MKNFLNSNLPSINKLYSFFYSNLFENELSKKRFYRFIIYTLMIFGIFLSFNLTKVLASDSDATLGKIVDNDGKNYDVWFETKKFGIKFKPKSPGSSGKCTYNYEELFTKDIPRNLKSIPNGVDEQTAKNIVWGGLAVFIPECDDETKGFWHTTKEGKGYHNSGYFNEVILEKSDENTKIVLRKEIGNDITTTFLCKDSECKDLENKDNTFKWIHGTTSFRLGHGIFHTNKNSEVNDFYNCHLAMIQADSTLSETKAKDICKKFICRNNDLKDAVLLMKTVNSSTLLDRSTDVNEEECANIKLKDIEIPLPDDTRTDGCAFYSTNDSKFESDCRFDIKESTPEDTCEDKNEIPSKTPFKYFCSKSNKVVKCQIDSFNPKNYKDVFKEDMKTLKSGEPQSKCYIPAEMGPTDCSSATNCNLDYVSERDPNKCCYGSGNSNCKSDKKILPSRTDNTKDLFCSSDNKVVICGKSPASNTLYYFRDQPPASSGGDLDNFRAFKAVTVKSSEISSKCSLSATVPTPPPAVASGCKIYKNSAVCEYGNPNTYNNCWDQNKKEPITLDMGGKYNLFCRRTDVILNTGKVIICPEGLSDYPEVFPGKSKTDTSPDFDSRCKEYFTGISEIEARASSCTLDEKNLIYLDKKLDDAQPAENITQDIPKKQQEFIDCVKEGKTTEECFKRVFGSGVSNRNFFRCECSTAYNPQYNYLFCSIGGDKVGFNCDEECILRPTNFANYEFKAIQESFNPINLIKTISDFLYALAVIIFIINMLRASFMYVTSGGDERKMKEAYTTITNTIFGMVFLVFIGGLIMYFITLATKIVGS
jgi:hypothetical protein